MTICVMTLMIHKRFMVVIGMWGSFLSGLQNFISQDIVGIQLIGLAKNIHFFVSLGGDGAPFGKNDVACAWLVSFLNVLSSNENRLLFGANCTETCLPLQRFIKILVADIAVIEQQSFPCTLKTSSGDIRTVNVRFQVSELPNDMKMIAFYVAK